MAEKDLKDRMIDDMMKAIIVYKSTCNTYVDMVVSLTNERDMYKDMVEELKQLDKTKKVEKQCYEDCSWRRPCSRCKNGV